LRPRAAVPSAQTVVRQVVRRAGEVRRRRPASESDDIARFLVVCGDDPLAFRLISELVSRYSAEVTAIMPDRRLNHGPRIARLPNVRIVESDRLDVEAFRHARLQQADAVAMVRQDDVGNIHAALQAQEVNPGIRLVIRMFNMSLGHGVRRMFRDCAVFSDAAMAAPAIVSAALGEVAPVHVRLQGRTLQVARRTDVPHADVVCGLARTIGNGGGPDMLPSDPARADLVLAVARGRPTGLAATLLDDPDSADPESTGIDGTGSDSTSIDGADTDSVSTGDERDARGRAALPTVERPRLATADDRPGPALVRNARARATRAWRRVLTLLASLVDRKLRLAALTLFVLLALGTVAMARVRHLSWGNGAYLTLLTTLAGAEPDLAASKTEKVLEALLTLISIALIPVVTAAVVEAVVNAKLALALGRTRGPISDHVVVVGLGNVGTRVIRQLHALGVPVVAVDRSDSAKGAQVARTLGIPLIIGDASREQTLRAASVQTCRALVCLSTDDVTNLEAALYGQGLQDDLRVVLRLFDGDFADRAERAFGITISRSVSYLAAPRFAAAMVERQVIGTIPIGRRVLLIAEVRVLPGSALDGTTVATANRVGEARVIAVTPRRGRNTTWSPDAGQILAADDTLTVVATRSGLARMLTEIGDPLARSAERLREV
jgi:Trk K+ transport system NAD-binding subunit